MPVLQLIDVSRSFPGVLALRNVNFDVRTGEVHALVGENGAGKSTLINIVSGVLPPHSGELLLQGQPVRFSNPVAARTRGIITVHQEAELFPTLSVAENMALGQGLPATKLGCVAWAKVESAARKAVAHIGEAIDVRIPAARLSIAHRHMTQVAAALAQRARVVVLDEPTSALSQVEAEWLFRQIERLRENGAGILYVSHRQDEIFRLADRMTVLRDGALVWTKARSDVTPAGLIQAMVGRQSPDIAAADQAVEKTHVGAAARRHAGQPALRVEGFTDAQGRFRDIHLESHAGQVVGIFGLVGSGRSELAQAVFGCQSPLRGRVYRDGRLCRINNPRDAVRAGIAYLPEDRLRQGVCGGLSLRANAVLSSLEQWTRGPLSNSAAERQASRDIFERLHVRYRSIEQPLAQLSGGNQQKVVLGRSLLTRPKVLILDEPTRGVDVGSKREIHAMLKSLARNGCAVVLISSELPEIMQHSDRVVVFRGGTQAGQFDPHTATAEDIASAALPATVAQEVRPVVRRATTAWARLPRGEFALAAVVVALCLWLMATSPGFQPLDLLTGTITSSWILLGLAAASVIISGGIDISIGSLMALSAACAAMVLKSTAEPWVTIPCAIATGALVGLLGGVANAAIALAGRVHPIVVTLGTMTIYRGLVVLMLGRKPMTGLPSIFPRLASDPQTGFRGAFCLAVLAFFALAFWLNHTRSGRHVYALGASPTAARLVGISKWRVWLLAFGIGGLLAGLAGVMELAYSGQMQANLGAGKELAAIATAVIGGVAITGGRGTVWGVLLGVVLLRLVHTSLVHWGMPGEQIDLLVGGMILAAVLLDLLWRRDST